METVGAEAALETSKLSQLANLSVGRGCAFGLFAIFCLMIGLAGYPVVALKTGGVALLLGSAVLILKAELSGSRNYKRTELWALLDKHERPQREVAQQVIGTTLREVFYRYAVLYAFGGFISFAGALAVQVLHALFG